MTNFRKRLSDNTQKLLFLLWIIIPFIPIVLIWNWLNPIGFVQSLLMFIVCCFLYVVFLVVVAILGSIFGDWL